MTFNSFFEQIRLPEIVSNILFYLIRSRSRPIQVSVTNQMELAVLALQRKLPDTSIADSRVTRQGTGNHTR